MRSDFLCTASSPTHSVLDTDSCTHQPVTWSARTGLVVLWCIDGMKRQGRLELLLMLAFIALLMVGRTCLEAVRQNGVRRLTYASGSGIYYCHMFELNVLVFRFANVVGAHQTHGVAYDFVRRLLRDPSHLSILGDGYQSKSYIYVDDVIGAMRYIGNEEWQGFDYFNVATEDYVTVREIADMVVDRLGLSNVAYSFTGGKRGWKGDVPIVRFDTEKIRAHGWRHKRTSVEALRDSIDSMVADAQEGKFDSGN